MALAKVWCLVYPAALRASRSLLPSRTPGLFASGGRSLEVCDSMVMPSYHMGIKRGLDDVAHSVALSLHVRVSPGTDLNKSVGAGRADFEQGRAMSDIDEFSELDDSALLSKRAEMRAELERLPPGCPDQVVLA